MCVNKACCGVCMRVRVPVACEGQGRAVKSLGAATRVPCKSLLSAAGPSLQPSASIGLVQFIWYK